MDTTRTDTPLPEAGGGDRTGALFPSRRARRSRAGAALALGAIALAAATGGALAARATAAGASHAASTGGPTGAANGATVTVSGTGTVTGRPDTLTLQMGATTTASSATVALDRNNAEIAALEDVFLRAGVKSANLQTSGLTVQANYDQNGDVTGYQAADELTVTFHELANAGEVIDAAAHAVGNDVHIDGIAFSISNTSNLLEVARVRAVRDAQAKAQAFASAAGARLGPVRTISDEEQLPAPVFQVPVFASGIAAAPSRVPLQAGSQQLSVQVRVVYELRG